MDARILRIATIVVVALGGACREDAGEYEPPVTVIRDTAAPVDIAADTASPDAADTAVPDPGDVAPDTGADAADAGDVAPRADAGDTGADAGGDAGALTATVACRSFAIAFCTRRMACQPGELLSRYRDAAACETAVTTACEGFLATADVGDTPVARRACGEALSSGDCRVALNADPARGCGFVAGLRPDGAGCARQEQCASQYCHRTGGACGTCMARFAIGDNCMTRQAACALGTTCLVGSGVAKCAALGGVGQPCSSTQPCHPSLNCVAGACVVQAALGAECRTRRCDDSLELACHIDDNICVTTPLPAAVGASCGPEATGSGAYVRCAAGSDCFERNARELCIADAAPGAACDDDIGPGCGPGYVCANDVCVAVPPAPTCPR